MARSADFLIRAGAVATMDADREVIADGAVAVADGLILAVGKASDLSDIEAKRVVDAPSGFLTPGLIDAHNHPQDTFLRGVLDDLAVGEVRMAKYVFPYEHGITEEEAYVASLATFAEMLLNGTTCFCDAGGPTPDGVARAAVDVGIRGTVARRCNDLAGVMNSPVEGDWREVFEKATETVEKWDGAADGRIRAAYNLDIAENVSDELCTAVRDGAADKDVGIVGHLFGDAQILDTEGRKRRLLDVERYEELGVLGPRVSLAHIGWINATDVAALKASDSRTVHCPSQSMYGASGVISHGSIPELVDAGVTVGLGSDASCISRFVDPVRLMYLAACAHRDSRVDPLVMGAEQAFAMGTIDGARSIGRDDEIGSLEAGKRADLVVFDASQLEWYPDPLRTPVHSLVYAANGRMAESVMVGGKLLVEEGRLLSIDVEDLKREVEERTRTSLGRLGLAEVRRRTAR